MTEQTNNINDILQYISSNNVINITLPYSNKTKEIKRYSVNSLNVINEVFEKEKTSEIAIEYLKYLFKLADNRIDKQDNYIDFLYVIAKIRETESSKYNNIDLTQTLKEVTKDKIKLEKTTTEFKDGPIKYKVEVELPTFAKLEKILSAAKTETKDIIFYNTFKFVKNIEIVVKDKRSSVSEPEDLYQLYNVLSYKALERISRLTNSVSGNIDSLFKVSIETDTGFLYSI